MRPLGIAIIAPTHQPRKPARGAILMSEDAALDSASVLGQLF
ncbi:MAG: hypothetical protein WBE78_18030 [Candidatus Binataceae bacterium]